MDAIREANTQLVQNRELLPIGLRARPLPPTLGQELLAAGRDHAGSVPEFVIDAEGGSPLRCCLRDSLPGDRLVLALVAPDGPTGPYREVGPVFVHAEPCAGASPTTMPAFWKARSQVLRAYDTRGRICGGTTVRAGGDVAGESAVLLRDPSVAFVQTRNVVYGCYMVTLERT